MKKLFIIRHAKSDWNDPSLKDFDRPLNGRGKSDAEMMSKRLKEKSVEILFFISSPAKRARKTAKIFMKEFDQNEKKLLLVPSLYEAAVPDFYDAIEGLDDKEDKVALFSHNPGITEFINSLECSPVYNMPTCAVFALKIKTKKWRDFRSSEKDFLFFDYPKNQE